LLVPSEEPGITNDALYTNSTVALDPKTGELAWHFQHLPNDQWDLDWAFERSLVELSIDGEDKTVVVTGGKQAIYDALEAETGKYLFSMNLGLENLVTAIDPETGEKHIDPALYPGPNKSITVCPHAGGSKNWIPNSYNPGTNVMYMALMESCMDLSPQQPGEFGLSSGVRWTLRPPPDHDGNYGRLQAVNLQTRETEWVVRQRAPRTSGVLATQGGLVFVGDLDRYFKAYNDATGEELWSIRLNDVPNSAPISFAVNGKQYIAITVGRGGPLSVDRSPLVPEIRSPSHPGAAVWVFESGSD
jgi:alcohol dehydrogenase (cytochrome c)